MTEGDASAVEEEVAFTSFHHHHGHPEQLELEIGAMGAEPVTTVTIVRTVAGRKPVISRTLIISLGLFVIFVLLAILISLLIHWYNSVYRHGHSRLRYNHKKMSGLQPKLIGRVRGLWEMANLSVHDTDAREYLRNLSRNDRSTCYSALCVHTALNLLESMEWKVDPCEDFYAFTCGGWMIRNPPGSTTSFTDHFAKINFRVIQTTQRIIEKGNPSDVSVTSSDTKGLQLARAFYKQCTNIEQLEFDGLQPIYKIMEEQGGWPLLYGYAPNDLWPERWSFNWIKVVALLQRLSIPTILSIDIKQDTAKPQANAIFVVEPLFFLSREYLVSPEKNMRLLTAYKQFVVDVAKEFMRWKAEFTPHLHVDPIRLEDMAENVITFEVNLAKAVTPDTTISNVETFYKLKQLQTETDKRWTNSNPQNKLNWKVFFEAVFQGSEVTIGAHEKVLVQDMAYLHGLVELLDRTPTETLANYVLWRLMEKFTTGSTKSLRKLHAKFYHDLYGEQRLMDRNSTCAMAVNNKFAVAIGSEFIKESFETSLKREVETLAANVKVRMEELLGRQSFIPHILQLAIRRKLTSIKLCVGFPRSFTNLTHVAQFYDDLDMDVESFKENGTYIEKYMSVTTWFFVKSLSILRQPFDTECWGGTYWSFIGEAYAYYDTARNSINLPVGLLQSPFYYQRPTVPWYLNYGGIGTIIGHELTHSLNIEGWIRLKLVQELENLWDCLISSYSETDIPELEGKSKVDGYRTRSENFADHLGLATAYWAYQQHIKSFASKSSFSSAAATSSSTSSAAFMSPDSDDREHSLPGLELFSSSQMFFISFANMWCSEQSTQSLQDEVESSTHTPSKYRVLGALRNSKDFSQVWSCEPGSKMNPKRKCNLF